MINKSINLQKAVVTSEGNAIAYLNAQIGVNCTTINTTTQIIDKQALELNKDLFKTEYYDFIEKINLEAINNGWEVLNNTIM